MAKILDMMVTQAIARMRARDLRWMVPHYGMMCKLIGLRLTHYAVPLSHLGDMIIQEL